MQNKDMPNSQKWRSYFSIPKRIPFQKKFQTKQNIKTFQVSWIRTRDLHILTSGVITFTADDRFESHRGQGSTDWSLRLRKTQATDSGIYECQVNTDPKINKKVTLDVGKNLNFFFLLVPLKFRFSYFVLSFPFPPCIHPNSF